MWHSLAQYGELALSCASQEFEAEEPANSPYFVAWLRIIQTDSGDRINSRAQQLGIRKECIDPGIESQPQHFAPRLMFLVPYWVVLDVQGQSGQPILRDAWYLEQFMILL